MNTSIPYIERKNILLDFLSPEHRALYGTFENYSILQHKIILEKSINICVFFCGEYCILPPGFLLQCNIARQAMDDKADFLNAHIIRLPIKEISLARFFEKKCSEYADLKPNYKGFFEEYGQAFVEKHADSIIKRNSDVGNLIAMKWEKASENQLIWKQMSFAYPKFIDDLYIAPTILRQAGQALTVSSIKKLLNLKDIRGDFQIGQALQHNYANTYIEEYDVEVIAGIPPKTTDFFIVPGDLSYDYNALCIPLGMFYLKDLLELAPAKFIIDLKYSEGCNFFLQSVTHACKKCNSRQNLRILYSSVSKEFAEKIIDIRERNSTILQKIKNNIQLSCDDLSRIEELMLEIADVTFNKTYNEYEESGKTLFIQGTEIINKVSNKKTNTDHEKRKIEYQINNLQKEIWKALPSYKEEAPEYYKKYNDVANELDELLQQLSNEISVDFQKIGNSFESLRKIWEDRKR